MCIYISVYTICVYVDTDSQPGPIFAFQRTFDNVWRHFWFSQIGGEGAVGIKCLEVRDASKYPLIERTAQIIWPKCPCC